MTMDLHLQLSTLSLTYLILTQIVLDLSLTIVKPSINVKMFLLIGVKYQFNYWKKKLLWSKWSEKRAC